MWTYRCTVHRVIDAPERRTPAGDTATDYVRALVAHDPADGMTVRTELDRSFARYLGELILSDGTVLAERLIQAGHGTYRAP